jgi:S-adenosylmethionine decarboxylase
LQSLGRHVLAEIYGCRFEVLNDIKMVQDIMINAALEAGAEVREFVFHKFSPQGKIGCVACKKRQAQVINQLLEPMHERREQYKSRDILTDILREGTRRAQEVARSTMEEVREAMKIQYFK